MQDNSTLVSSTSAERMPLSYVEYLKAEGYNNLDTVEIFNNYNNYVKAWYENAKTTNATNLPSISRILYINFLQEIALKYATVDEKRFLSNIDFNSDKDLDVIIPFFVRKLKNVTKYYKGERHNIEHAKVKHSLKGSVLGVKALVTDLVLDLLGDKDFTDDYPTATIPELSTISKKVEINIDELYDEYEFYFNSTKDSEYNSEEIDSDAYLFIEELISNLVRETSPSQATFNTGDGLSLLLNVEDTATIIDVDISKFVGTEKTVENLITSQQKALFEKFNNSGYNYLSAGTTSTNFVTGSLFDATNPSANLLNTVYSSHATSPVTTDIYKISEKGKFFSPDRQGLLKFESVNLITSVDPDKIEANTLYIFPNQDNIETASAPYKFTDSNEVIRFSKANDQGYGMPSARHPYQKFFPYQSRTETLNDDVEGISRSVDSVDFWSGEEKDIWANDDVYKFSGLVFDPDAREKDLLLGPDTIEQWKTDYYGNNFALHKDTHIIRKTAEQVASTLSGSSTSDFTSEHFGVSGFEPYTVKYFDHQGNARITIYESVTETISAYQGIYVKQNKQGKLYHRRFDSTIVNPLSTSLSAVFIKYTDTDMLTELNNNVVDFDVIDNVIIITTPTYQIVEKYDYDFDSQIYRSLFSSRTFLSAGGGLQKIARPWYDETSRELLLCRTVVAEKFSNTYGKAIFPEIKKVNIDTGDITIVNELSGSNRSQFLDLITKGYSLSGTGKKFNITSIDRPIIKNNKKDNTALVVIKGTDQGDKDYLISYFFDSQSTPYEIDTINILKPDINIYNLDVGSFPILNVSQDDNYKNEVGFDGGGTGFDTVTQIPGTELSGMPGVSGIFAPAENIIKLGTYYDVDNLGNPLPINTDTGTAAPYTYNSSYLTFKLPLSSDSRDIEISFDIAVFNGIDALSGTHNLAYLREGYATTEIVLENRTFLTTEAGEEIHIG